MDLTFLQEYIVVIVCMICLCIGYIIKNLIPAKKINRYIPLIMGGLGIFLNVWLEGWRLTPLILLGGLISGLASTGLHQAFTKLINMDK